MLCGSVAHVSGVRRTAAQNFELVTAAAVDGDAAIAFATADSCSGGGS